MHKKYTWENQVIKILFFYYYHYQELEEQGEEINDDVEDEFYLKRLDAGLFILQLIVCIMLENCSSGVSSVS